MGVSHEERGGWGDCFAVFFFKRSAIKYAREHADARLMEAKYANDPVRSKQPELYAFTPDWCEVIDMWTGKEVDYK